MKVRSLGYRTDLAILALEGSQITDARRRGLAGTLVMVADPDDVAIRVYRSVGFTVSQDQVGFIRQSGGRPGTGQASA